VLRLFAGVDLILHAGDVGCASIPEALSRLAPTIAVRGNVDEGTDLDHLPVSVTVCAGGIALYMTHVFTPPCVTPPRAGEPGDPVPPGTRVAIFGHSHLPILAEGGGRDGAPVLYFNPASAGRKRFGNPRLAGLLTIADGAPAARHLSLEGA
jgi:predicted phosphodiesterase